MDAAASLRVLLVSDVSPLAVLGGSERVLWEEARRLAARHRVRILSRAADGGPADAERDGVRIRQFPVDARSASHRSATARPPATPPRWWPVMPRRDRYSSGADEWKV